MSNFKKVVVGVIEKDGKYLMLKHNKCKGLYLFPSGKVEQEESIIDALKRELNEEVDIEVKSCFKVFDSPILSWYDRTDGIMLTQEYIYNITDYDGVLYNKEPNKHEELVWVSKDEVINNPQKFTYQTFYIVNNI